MSTVNGMAYLKDAIYELVNDSKYSTHKEDLLRLHGAVIRTMKRLVKDYKVNLSAIKTFNTRKVLSNRNFTYLKKGKNRDTRKNRKTRKNRN
jgi:23S rRNA maturation mini-RNase III